MVFEAPPAMAEVSRRCAPTTSTSAGPKRRSLSSATGDNPANRGYRTWLLRRGDEVILNALLRHSRVKSYLKCSRALRTDTVINDTVIPA